MNIFKWLASKAGKITLSTAQAVGITAVVGAAGVAAITYFNSPADNNTAFYPPSAYEQQEDNRVYISQSGGGGAYAANGEIQSSFHARQSDSIRLANAKFEREQRANALKEADTQPSYASQGEETGTPKAYQMGGSDLNLGGGDSIDKQMLNGGFDLANLQKEIPGLGNIVNNAQAGAAAQGAAGGAAGGSKTDFSKASADYTRVAGGGSSGSGGSGSGSSYVIQDSGKNAGGKDAAAAMAQVGNMMADAQAAMNRMQEGARMRSSRASFGRSDGLGEEKDARGQGGRSQYTKAKNDLERIRKQSAAIDKNAINAANAGGLPFLASDKVTGGLTVEGDQVTTGQGSSSVDLGSTDRQMRGIKAGLGSVQSNMEERTKKRHDLRKWMWWALPLALVTIPLIGAFATIGRAGIPIVSAVAWACAAVLAAVTLWPTIKLLIAGISYANTYGGDFVSIFSSVLGGLLTAGVGLALAVPGVGSWLGKLPTWILGAGAGIGVGGATLFHFLSKHGDGYTDEQLDDNTSKGEIEERDDQLRSESK